jgi:N-acetylneuraminic acid mutarotase
MHMYFKYLILLLFFPSITYSQTGWTWTELNNMPERISNNAVTQGVDGSGNVNVYSFSGIDSTKIYSGINLKSYRYNVTTATWDTIASLPDGQGKIAAGASTIKNKIYIVGGYHVNANGSEVSSAKVHIYDPVTNNYLLNGADIPVPIDDHVQATWRDSLIYVVTGWSNNNNVPDVQIYDPANDNWLVGTATPNITQYKMFGASGVIIGDTIYYNGGVTSGLSFNATSYLRMGVINPIDPTVITWSQLQDNPGGNGYRMAAAKYNNRCFWIGGSGTAYNYDGIAYNGSGGVEPHSRILTYQKYWNMWFEGFGSPYGIMDLRGIAQITPTSWIICGGMETGQTVTNRAFLLEFDPQVGGIGENLKESIALYPNPSSDYISLDGEYENTTYKVFSTTGGMVLKGVLTNNTIEISALSNGFYQLELSCSKKVTKGGFVVSR